MFSFRHTFIIIISFGSSKLFCFVLIFSSSKLHMLKYIIIGFGKSQNPNTGTCFKIQVMKSDVSSMQISEIKKADIPDVDLSCLGVTNYGNFSVEVVDPVTDYLDLMEVKT